MKNAKFGLNYQLVIRRLSNVIPHKQELMSFVTISIIQLPFLIIIFIRHASTKLYFYR